MQPTWCMDTIIVWNTAVKEHLGPERKKERKKVALSLFKGRD